MKRIMHCPQIHAERMTPDANMACISITEPDVPPAKLNGWSHLLRLCFHDVDKQQFPDEWEGMTEKYTFFDENMAKQILDFVDALPPNIDTLVVHCYAGISRSAAVSRVLHSYFDIPVISEGQYLLLNKHVRRLLEIEIFARAWVGKK